MLEKIGKYEIRKEIGRGAMGTVYEGFDPVIGRRVAVKTLRTEVFDPSQLPDVLERFKREAQSAGRLAHPHIITIYDYGAENGIPYIVMEFMTGTELGVFLARGSRFPLDEIVRLMTQLLAALAVAHENGVVHRDLKPANMFLLQDGSLKVVDFGIAHVEASDLTDTGMMLGTPAYMSPEQCLGTKVDHRSDLFSAGVIFYQLLTGDKPFTGSLTTIIQKVMRQEPLPPSELNPMISTAWDKVVARAMAKKPEARYESARQFSEAIKVAFQADHAHEAEAQRKAAEAAEHAHRAAEERSRAEAARRIEEERREVEEKARAETARRKAEETVAMPPARSRKPVIAALAVVAALGVLAAVLFPREDVGKRMADAEAARVAAESRAREETEKRTKAEALAREEGDKRSKLEADAARREADAKRDAELAAKVRAEEEAKKVVEEKTKVLALKKDELAARLQAESEARRKAEEQAKKDAAERAKADAAKKVEEAPQAVTKPGTAFRDCDGCPEMVMIPAGNFLMGSPDSEAGRSSDEGPQHRVSISRPFAAGKYEVTFDEWDACVRESGCSHNPSDQGWGRGKRPVINVSWQDAKKFTEWLSRKSGKRYRLLTEAEWEYVARAGTTTAYSTGATIATSQANYSGNLGKTVAVGSYGPNAFGVHDVHGNVYEWTEDCWNASYAGAPTNGSAWLSGDCSDRVSRGGSWSDGIGFRLARTLE